jgi:hypothetical protein
MALFFRWIMPRRDTAYWSERLREMLERYDEPLLREVAGRLIKPRNQWPVADLVERCAAAVDNPAVLDRRLQDLEPASRQVLALIARSRQPRWVLGNLVELAMALGHADGLKAVLALLEGGLLYPDGTSAIKSFEQWLVAAAGGDLTVFTHPDIAARAVNEPLDLPDLSESQPSRSASAGSKRRSAPALGATHESDGLEWLLRLAVLWQQVAAVPLRRTMQGGFFKRDAERLGQDPLLTGAPADRLADVPDLGFLLAALAELEGIVVEADGEVQAGTLPNTWDDGPAAALAALWVSLFRLRAWNPLDGWRGEETAGNPFPSAYLLAFLLLDRLPADAWARPAALEDWVTANHPYWHAENLRPSRHKPWLETLLLGFAYHLRLIEAKQADVGWVVRLSPTGRWLLGAGAQSGDRGPTRAGAWSDPAPDPAPAFPQTLLVQPNLEVVAFRQGLTPNLIGRLTRFATWKNVGVACTLQLEPASVYRGLENGETFDSIRLTLEQHGTRAVPPAVIDALRTWSDKRDRITVYPSATLLEFSAPNDLADALARGLKAVRISDTMAVVASEDQIDYTHFRLTGTRDYSLPPERCVSVEPDGVTLVVDVARSDLLLETDLPRIAVPLGTTPGGKRQYRITPASLAGARESWATVANLETWFVQRTGQPMPAAVRMLLTAAQMPPPRFKRQLVLHLASEEIADGLLQWPETRDLIESRLGPTTLVVPEQNVPLLRERLKAVGVTIEE